MKKRLLNVDAFLLDIDEYDVATINDFMSIYFSTLSSSLGAPISFKYTKTTNGYTYRIERNCNYHLHGNYVMDVDCALITGLKTEDFMILPHKPDHQPKTYCMRWYDGFYTPADELEKLYKILVSADDTIYETPKKVKISADSTRIEVSVEYA